MAAMFWQVALGALETWLRADAAFAALVTHAQGDAQVVDIAQGITPTIDPPCARLMRGPQGSLEGTAHVSGPLGEIPGQIILFLDLHAPDAVQTDDLSASDAWARLAQMEAAAIASLRAFFAPTRSTTTILGAPFAAQFSGPVPVAEEYHPAVASRLTILLNKEN